MSGVTWELRTRSGAPVLRFDNEARARAERTRRAKVYGTGLRLFRITQVEEEIAA